MSRSKKVLLVVLIVLLAALAVWRTARPKTAEPEEVLAAVLTAAARDSDPARYEEIYGGYFTPEGMEQALQNRAFTAFRGQPGLEGPLGLNRLGMEYLTEGEDEVRLHAAFRVACQSSDSGEEVSTD
ncbi:MAG: hypothetical protein PUC36_08460 [Clostridiales bacterium]|nr:hypothetical protein [Clostridiales bacterium]